MKTVLFLFIACVCATIAQEEVKEPRDGPLRSAEDGLTTAVDGLREVGRVARMFSALSGAFEILIYVILKNFVDLDIPNQIFNLLQIGLYFSYERL